MTTFHNYHTRDVLLFIKLVYSMLREGGIWIDLSTANFSRNAVLMGYREYENILEKSQFKLLKKDEV